MAGLGTRRLGRVDEAITVLILPLGCATRPPRGADVSLSAERSGLLSVRLDEHTGPARGKGAEPPDRALVRC